MSNFDEYVSKTIEFETGGKKDGAYHHDPDDKGGETKWGISARAHPDVKIKFLTYKRAIAIYKNDYYHPLFESIDSKRIAFKLFDMSVLMGPKVPIRALQRVLVNTLKIRLKPDGKYGPLTHAALQMANSSQERHIYSGLVEKLGNRLKMISYKPGNRKFLVGWMRRINHIFLGT